MQRGTVWSGLSAGFSSAERDMGLCVETWRRLGLGLWTWEVLRVPYKSQGGFTSRWRGILW